MRSAACLLAISGVAESRVDATLTANPIRRVVTMLQMMQNKVTAEGKKEKELFDKFMCYCKTGVDDLEASINAADSKIPQVEAQLKEDTAMKAQLESETKGAQETRRECKEAIATATAIRTKEANAYAKESGEMKSNIDAMSKAVAAIEKGAGGGFLQTSSASVVRKLSIDMDLSNADRDQIVSFLAAGNGYAPASGAISGILNQMLDTMKADLVEATKAEDASKASFDDLVAAKEKEIEAATKAVEDKLTRIGNLGVKIAATMEDLDDTGKAMVEDKKFLEELKKGCSTKEGEWDERCKVRTEELLALADTIKMLNDDDALELFKKTLPGAASLLQMKVSNQDLKRQALAVLSNQKDFRLDLISLAIRGQKVSFDKVIKMIDEMVALLKKEQGDDADKKEVCEKQIDKAEDDLKILETTISDLEKSLEDTKEEIATLTDEIKALHEGIEDLDKMVEEATTNRKEEHEDYVTLMTNNGAAKQLIGMAKNRMNKFYNPSMYKAPPKRELSEEERITLNMGGTLAPTEAPGGIAGTGITVLVHLHSQGAPPPPPETFGAYSKKSEESNGVIAMMDSLVADLDKEIQEAEFEENDSQSEYEAMMKESATKRVDDSKAITDKEAAKAEGEANVQTMGEERTSKMKEAMATVDVLENLHGDCDWLLQNFDLRRDARSGEMDALKKAKAVLSGADFS